MKAGRTLTESGFFKHVECTNHRLESTTDQNVHSSSPRIGDSLHQVFPGGPSAFQELFGTVIDGMVGFETAADPDLSMYVYEKLGSNS